MDSIRVIPVAAHIHKENIMAFYKVDNGELLVGENFVHTPTASMFKESKDDYTYPIEGWYWFDSESEALATLDMSTEEEKQ